MKCPRCSLFDIPDGAPACAVCGYQLPGANAEPASPPPSPSSPGPPAPGLTELDARRELAREFRIEALLSAGDETTTAVYLAYDPRQDRDRKSTRLNSSHSQISYAVFCLTTKQVRTAP